MLQTDSFEMTAPQSHGALGLFECSECLETALRVPRNSFSSLLVSLEPSHAGSS